MLNSTLNHAPSSFSSWKSGMFSQSMIFSIPYNIGRHMFIVCGNIASLPYFALCTTNDISSTLNDVTVVNMTNYNISDMITIKAGAYNNDKTQLIIQIISNEEVGNLFSVIVPYGKLI